MQGLVIRSSIAGGGLRKSLCSAKRDDAEQSEGREMFHEWFNNMQVAHFRTEIAAGRPSPPAGEGLKS